jgi:hypothetical protein
MATDNLALGLNPDLQTLHDNLIATAAQLADSIGDAPDADTVNAIVTEISELNHRATLVGNLLFTLQSSKITSAVQKVKDATSDLNKNIQNISSATDVIKTVSAFLTLVDKAIDTAKLLAAA